MLIYCISVLLSFAITVPMAARLRRDGEVRLGLFLCLVAVALVPFLNIAAGIFMIILAFVDMAESNTGPVVFKIKK